MSKGVVIVADDDAAIRTVLNQALTRAGFTVKLASKTSTLLELVEEGEADCVVSDVIMPDGDAFETLPKIKQLNPDLPVILISAQNTFVTALRAQETGAYEYLPKPFDLQELIEVAERAIFEPKNNSTTEIAETYSQGMPLVGRSTLMQDIYRSIVRLVHTNMSVMISGEPGTGKRLIARVLHDFGDRKHSPFIPVNLSALPSDMIEGDLFGRVNEMGEIEHGLLRQADGGTLFLDEISELPMAAQTRLLRVLMQFESIPVGSTNAVKVNVRIISTSSKNINTLIEQGSFREDLFYRLNVVPLQLSSLINRVEDIPDLARHFIKLAEMEGSTVRHLDPAAIQVLKQHTWPGNVRELENLIKRICILYPQETITAMSVETEIRNSGYFQEQINTANNSGFSGLRGATEFFAKRYFAEHEPGLPEDGVYQRFLEEFEYPLLASALAATNGNQIKAAKILGLNRNTLRKKIQEHGIRIIKTAR